MGAGRPSKVDPGVLFVFAHQFYWDFKTIAEGLWRIHRDAALYKRLAGEAEAQQLTEKQLACTEEQVLQEMRYGLIAEDKQLQRNRELKGELLFDIKFRKTNQAAELSSRWKRVPGEPDVIERLFTAKTPEQIAEICADAFSVRRVQIEPGVVREVKVRNWPISGDSMLPVYLSEFASEFIAARNDQRFPKSNRPTNRLKQLWFLSRALAGAVHGLKTRTAINLVGSLRPEQVFRRSRDGKSARKIAHRTRAVKHGS